MPYERLIDKNAPPSAAERRAVIGAPSAEARTALCEMYPECGSFTALVVLGKKELDQALQRLDSFGVTVRRALQETPCHHDGCWMYLRLTDPATCQQDVQDIEQLILIEKKPPRKKPAVENNPPTQSA